MVQKLVENGGSEKRAAMLEELKGHVPGMENFLLTF